MTEPVTALPRPAADTHTFVEWLDSLSAGECDRDAFFTGVGELLQRSPDSGWELLALADQYYRRGRITAETFGDLKAHLHDLLMGNGRDEPGPAPRARPDQAKGSTAAKRVSAAAPAPIATRTASASAASDVTFGTGATGSRFRPAFAPVPRTAAAVRAVGSERPADRSRSYADERAAAANRAAATVASAPVTARTAALANSAYASDDAAADAEAPDATRLAQQPPVAALAVGDVLRDRYRIQGVLGQGGMGTVFEAIDQYRVDRTNDGQKVAIKVLHSAVIQRPQLFAALRREFQVLQSLSHPNIVRVHEFDRDGETAFFSMEYLSGALLSRVLSSHASAALYRPYASSIIRDVGAAVAHAHACGVIHGDLHPGNVFVTDDGDVRVLDFGASHELRRGPWISEFEEAQQAAVATPAYASCQLLEGEAADVRDDVYALAAVAYVLLTGNHPFGGHNALKARTLRMTPERPRGLGRQQWQALRAGLRFERDRRPADVHVWLQKLAQHDAAAHLPTLPKLWAAHPPASGARWVAAAAVAALVIMGIAWTLTHRETVEDTRSLVASGLKSTFADTVIGRWWDERNSVDDVGTAAPAPAARHPSATARAALDSAVPSRTAAQITPAAAAPPVVVQPDPRVAIKATSTQPAQPVQLVQRPPAASSASTAPAAAAAPAPLYRARVELTADTVDVPATEAVAHLIVRRSRSLKGDASFSWWTETGTAKPGRDFVPVKLQVEHMDNGKSSVSLLIPIVVDPKRRDARSFYVVIDEAGDSAAVGPRTLSMVTIQPSE